MSLLASPGPIELATPLGPEAIGLILDGLERECECECGDGSSSNSLLPTLKDPPAPSFLLPKGRYGLLVGLDPCGGRTGLEGDTLIYSENMNELGVDNNLDDDGVSFSGELFKNCE